MELSPGTYTRRKNPILLSSEHLYGCHAGTLVHAVMERDEHELGEVAWTK